VLLIQTKMMMYKEDKYVRRMMEPARIDLQTITICSKQRHLCLGLIYFYRSNIDSAEVYLVAG
jgi:hypothetical protein